MRLSPKPAGIRLIQLQPSEDKAAMIQCRLIHTTLAATQKDVFDHYTALSYVWGSPSDRVTISVDGKSLAITKNLDSALKHLRDATRVLSVWADGISIDQQNKEEKNTQVQQMRQVYEFATHTIIFLGAATEASALLFDAVESFQMCSDFSETFKFMEKNNLLHSSLHAENREPASEKAANSFVGYLVKALDGVLSSPWFYRVWIYQELMLSRDPRVQCGNQRCMWDNFYLLAGRLSHSSLASSGLKSNSFSVLATLHEARFQYLSSVISKPEDPEYLRANALHALLETLISRRGFGVYDARDMIYAHLGIIKNTGIKIDYGQSAGNLYSDFAKEYINTLNRCNVLMYLEDTDLDTRMPNLKSWAPDWSRVTTLDNSIFRQRHPNAREFGGHREEWGFDYSGLWASNMGMLCCFGYVAYRVTDLSAVMPEIVEEQKSTQLKKPLSSYASSVYWVKEFESLYKPWQDLLKPDQLTWLQDRLQKRASSWESRYIGERNVPKEKYEFSMHEEQPLELHIADRSESVVGRRIASLGSDQIALVPASTKIGDQICLFKHYTVSFVAREMSEVAPEIVEQVVKDASSQGSVNRELDGWDDIRHFRIVGECFVNLLGWGDWYMPPKGHKLSMLMLY